MTKVSFSIAVFLILFTVGEPSLGQQVASLKIRLEHLDGSTSMLADHLKDGPVYLTFWATWCEPCKLELRALNAIRAAHPDRRFSILAVNQDTPRGLAKVRAYIRSQDYRFPVILDPNGRIFQDFNGQNIPFSVLIAPDGKILSTRTGYLPGDEQAIEKELLTHSQ